MQKKKKNASLDKSVEKKSHEESSAFVFVKADIPAGLRLDQWQSGIFFTGKKNFGHPLLVTVYCLCVQSFPRAFALSFLVALSLLNLPNVYSTIIPRARMGSESMGY